ncbi:M20/M25/M40 family metallo-hydrolase [Galbibacter sp. EGI 63066]|uniref:M28 family peptidase n=1 Tax=Galbibacter sp. EGI 63066 TaxID=2993559 RepID=UPI002248E8FF|nr:M20/M25/M40 family metallo-hydrolase [Galbibacter sp. EGI 63066]MCX2680950.1 M20/M25/M40 family metallo-hydrolase [Galbibacter sp. EGI 63066]
MKKFSLILSFIILIAAAAWGFYDMMPQKEYAPGQFSTENALKHIKTIAEAPHYVGSKKHEEVKKYVISELSTMGLEVETQEGYTSGDWGNVSKAINIIAKIEGSGNGKALVLMAHYDSNTHSSKGASDDAVGVAVILESIRGYLEAGNNPKNDIIILFTDAEELGLNGAQLFVDEHPLAKDIGLILNFEARGSGGPSYMLIETNGGNKNLIETFNEANPEFPVANSLAYSIYKMLPNDTDLTVFREDADIEGFNFAFIDDHYDYHTVNDSYENLDSNSLQHQISYLIPLLEYYSTHDLTKLKSEVDYIYFDFPIFNFVYYPYSWVFPMLILAVLLFLILIGYGIKNQKLTLRGIFQGFGAFFITLTLTGIIGYFSWTAITALYPQYLDILHGFTYNGHLYIAGFTALSFALCFYVYSKFKKTETANLLIAPIFVWLLICTAIAVYLKGASFFIIQVYGALAALLILVSTKKEKPSLLFLLLLCFPGLWMLSPLIQMLPVGLGLKTLASSCIISVFLFGLLIPVFGFYKQKKKLALLGFVLCAIFLISAHFQSDFTEERPHPTSLLYLFDSDNNTANWATYNKSLDNWTSQYLGDNKRSPEDLSHFSSKYGTGFSYVSETTVKNIQTPDISIVKDTVIGNERHVGICVVPYRNVNRLEVRTNEVEVLSCAVNNVLLSKKFIENRKDRLFTHYISNNDYTEISLTFDVSEKPVLIFYEASYDLLEHELFSIPDRPDNAIPMPFVINDAVMVKKTLKL